MNCVVLGVGVGELPTNGLQMLLLVAEPAQDKVPFNVAETSTDGLL